MAQWLRFWASKAGGIRSIPGQGTKIPHAMWHGQKKKKKETENPRLHPDLLYQNLHFNVFLADLTYAH